MTEKLSGAVQKLLTQLPLVLAFLGWIINRLFVKICPIDKVTFWVGLAIKNWLGCYKVVFPT